MAETTDILSLWWYLDWDAFSDVQNKLHIGVVVVVSPSWHRHVMICHFDVLWENKQESPFFSQQIILLLTHLQHSSLV